MVSINLGRNIYVHTIESIKRKGKMNIHIGEHETDNDGNIICSRAKGLIFTEENYLDLMDEYDEIKDSLRLGRHFIQRIGCAGLAVETQDNHVLMRRYVFPKDGSHPVPKRTGGISLTATEWKKMEEVYYELEQYYDWQDISCW